MLSTHKRLIASLAFGAAVAMSCTTHARGINDIQFNSVRCGEFLQDVAEADEESVGYIFMWLDGYLSGVSGDTTLRWRGLENFGNSLVNYCAANPRTRVLEAARGVGIEY